MGWPEVLQFSSFILFSLTLFCLLIKCQKIKKWLLIRKEKNLTYVRTKSVVSRYLNEKAAGAEISKYEEIVKNSKGLTIHRLTTGIIKKWCQPNQVCKEEKTLENIFENLLIYVHEEGVEENNLIKALRFLLKSQTMDHPFDIVRSRRALVMFEVLDSVLERRKSGEVRQTLPIVAKGFEVERYSLLHWTPQDYKLLLMATFYILLRFFPLYFNDWASDILVLDQNHKLYVKVENITFPSLENLNVSRKSFLNSIPWDVAGALLGISTLLTLPKLAHLKDLINIRCIMRDPQTQIADLRTNIETVVKRNDASLVETSTESSVQVVFQWGSFMSLSYLIGKVKYAVWDQDEDFTCLYGTAIQNMSHQQGSEVEHLDFMVIICELEGKVAFRQDVWQSCLLCFSGLTGLLSLTLAQLKGHNVQHEFSTSARMKILFFFASLASTLSYLILLVSCFASTLDSINLATDELYFRGHSQLVLEVNRVVISVFCLLVICSLSLLARFIIFKNKSNSPYSIRITRTQISQCSCLARCCICWEKLKTRLAKFFCSSNLKRFLGNTLKFLSLPASQYCYKDKYFCYQSVMSYDYIKFCMVQIIFYIFLMMYNATFLVINNTILFFKQKENTFPPQFSASSVSISRQNLALFSSLVIPFGWGISYLLLWVYFYLDKGFFSGTNMRFRYSEDGQTGEVIKGTWEDLNEYHHEEKDSRDDQMMEPL